MAFLNKRFGSTLCACALALTIAFSASTFLPNPVQALSTGPVFDPAYLEGIDTILLISSSSSPPGLLLPWPPQPPTNPPPNIIFRTVEEIFAEQPWVTITRTMDLPDQVKPNVMAVEFVVSAQETRIDDRPVTVAALSLLLWQRSPSNPSRGSSVGPPSRAIPSRPVTFPFIVPDNTDQFQQELAQGIRLLAGHLPSYLACANNIGKDPCYNMRNPYLSKTPSPNELLLQEEMKRREQR